jgi:hypothetical protein
MNPTTIKTLMSLVGTIAAAAMLVPQMLPYQAALSALSAGLLAWAHGKRPGDASARRTEGLKAEIEELKGPGPKTPRTGSVPPSGPAAAALLLLAGALALNQAACGKQALPPGCTEADFAALAATCPDEDECNRLNEERRARCSEKVEAE